MDGKPWLYRPVGAALACLLAAPLAAVAATDPVTPAALSATVSADVVAGQTERVTLQQAVERAMQTHPALAAAGYEIAASEGALDQASRLRNPEAVFITEDVRRNRATMTAQLNIPLELGGKRAARTRAAELGRDAVTQDAAVLRAELRADVTRTFFDLLIAQERLTLAQASDTLAAQAESAAARRVQAGKVSPVEQTKAGVARASAAIELRDAGAELLVAQRALSAFWGGAAAAPEADGSAETLPVVPREARQATTTLDNTPRAVRARLEIDRRQALANVERSKRVPDVTVNVGVKRDSSANNNMAVLGIAVPLPLFDRNQGNLLEAQRLADKAFEDYRALQLEQNATLAQDVARLDAARTAVQSLRQDVLPGAQRAYDAARIGFDAGKFNFLDVLDAQRTLFQARAQYLAALSRAHQAAAGIDRILGR
ncbi:TolC family protein [Ralstonia insidiosa]|jgi:cobalt-zinc-cadmium efflux system outer membrane protein|uniref:TolC family protein n=1 Tax=Ralstonia TaxID=48736 RepID=UPI0009E41B7C|nr:TolC family protein [Ralstonia insidiosa]MBX3775051.1 TolC family protein [Ralstonia pickettii]NOZ18114.1 TolC family protein [Betaproteobacteria bacterium]MBA9859140.1 TolC family protein [Ralstonia insidiosa]MBA9872512.1 TolC family protein [Ralstonia insidiosa]MBA9915722.1 TolC family protein [Ralstonia insidiosa]